MVVKEVCNIYFNFHSSALQLTQTSISLKKEGIFILINNIFDIYIEPTDDLLNTLWSESIFVFDTSALLYFYYFSKTSRTEIFDKTLHPLKEKVWIPQHVMFEYLKNREETIKKPIKEKYEKSIEGNIKPISLTLKEIEGKLKNFKNTTQKGDSHPYIETGINDIFLEKFIGFKSEFQTYEKNIDLEFKKRRQEILSILEDDDVLNYINNNFEIGSALSYDEIMDIIQEGEIRYRNKIPPGYEDEKNKSGTQKYGDLIIWKQILSYAKEKSKSVIFITNDVKIDWCYSNKHDGESRISKPREDLIKEFNDSTNSKFWMYTFNQFLYYYQKVFGTTLNQDVLDEATLVIADNQPYFELEFDTGSTIEAENFVKNNINNIGKLISVKHSRNMKEINYETEIIGEQGSLKIYGGLTSGYPGGGPNGFIRVLTNLGLRNDIATDYVKGNQSEIHSFEIPFNKFLNLSHSLFGSNEGCPVCGNTNWNGARCMSCGTMYED